MRLIDADYMRKQVDMHGTNKYGMLDENIRVFIDQQPTITPEDKCGECDAWNQYKNYSQKLQWIPCSERLPEDLEEVNVTWVNHDPEPYYDLAKDIPSTASAVYYRGKWYWYSSVCADMLAEYGRNDVDEIDKAIEAIAWMPLPAPYKGVNHDS